MERRDFLKTAGMAAATMATAQLQGCGGSDAVAATMDTTIRNARIVTMDDGIGDLPRGDITVIDGKIAQVGRNLQPVGTVIDGTNFIAMPGLVNCMDHFWTVVFKGLVGDNPQVTYNTAKAALGPYTTDEDAYAAAYYSSLAFLNAGVTTVGNQNHNAKSEAHVEAGIRAMRDAGLRGVMNWGSFDGQPAAQATDWAAVESIQRKIGNGLGGGLVSLAFYPRSLASLGTPLFTSEINNALQLRLPLSLEGSGTADYALLNSMGALGPNVHALLGFTPFSAADLQMFIDKGVSVQTEPLTIYGAGATAHLSAVNTVVGSGINVGLSTDNLTGASVPSILDQARSLSIAIHGVSGDGFAYRHKSALRCGTINGARALGLHEQTGSLTPGKQADIVLVRTNTLTMANTEDLNPYRLLFGAQIGDVDTVMVAGHIVKQNGTMIGVDVDKVQKLLSSSLARLRAAANWPTTSF